VSHTPADHLVFRTRATLVRPRHDGESGPHYGVVVDEDADPIHVRWAERRQVVAKSPHETTSSRCVESTPACTCLRADKRIGKRHGGACQSTCQQHRLRDTATLPLNNAYLQCAPAFAVFDVESLTTRPQLDASCGWSGNARAQGFRDKRERGRSALLGHVLSPKTGQTSPSTTLSSGTSVEARAIDLRGRSAAA
jgi:hypothetical protein